MPKQIKGQLENQKQWRNQIINCVVIADNAIMYRISYTS